MNNKAFTLVELIVVVTILAILGTIWFISFTWYTSEARDSSRVSDMATIKKAIEIYEINKNKLPEISDPTPVYYNWEVVFYQWTFWSKTIASLEWQIGNFPVDPLTWEHYSFSKTNNSREYELGWFFENENYISFVETANAAYKTKAILKWTYNGRALSIINWTNLQLIASPSITVNDLSSDNFSDIVAWNKFVYDKKYNLPSNFSSTSYDLAWSWDKVFVNQSSIELYNWEFDDLKNDANKIIFLENMIQAYDSTDLQDSLVISSLLRQDTTNTSESLKYINTFLGQNISDKLN